MSNQNTATVIESPEYATTRQALKSEPAIQKMLAGILENETDLADFVARVTHDDGAPRWTFMHAALRTYNAWGGAVPTHIGGPSEVLIEMVRAVLTASERRSG